MRRRKSSLSITLVLIGTGALSGCGESRDQNTRVMRRDVYASLEDCRADWERADDCEVRSNATSTDGSVARSAGYFLGPRYYWADSSGRYDTAAPRPGSRATGVTMLGGRRSSGASIPRGGFGTSSAMHGGSSVS